MYSAAINRKNLALANKLFQRQYPHDELMYHSIDLVQEMNEHFEKIRGKDGQFSRDLTPEEAIWITNERMVCRVNHLYTLTRYCNPPEAPIWMGDFTFKPIGDIKVGDTVIGWTKGRTSKTANHRLEKTKVVAIARRNAPIVKVTMESGRVIRCTPDHLWANGSKGRFSIRRNRRQIGDLTYYPWTRVRIGAKLQFIVEPDAYNLDGDDLREAGWLGGIYDGEGSCSKHGGMNIAQCPDHNPGVHARIARALNRFNIPFTILNSEGKASNFNLTGGFRERLRFLNIAKPVRRERIESSLLLSKFATEDRVINVEPDGFGEVVSMETETGNYVAWGYGSKNCKIKDRFSKIVLFKPNLAQKIIIDVLAEMEEAGVELVLQFLKARRLGVSTLFQLLVAIRIMFSRNISVISSAANPETADKLSKMLWLAIEQAPFWMRPLCPFLGDSPTINGKPNGRYKTGIFYEFSNGVRLDIEHGDQKADPGRGENPSVGHFSEAAKIEHAENLIDAGFMKAMIPSPMNLACFEGTGEGNSGWWPEKWEFNKRWYGQPGSGARMKPTFLGWYVGRDIYPDMTWLRTQGWDQVKNTWEPLQPTIDHADQCAKAVHADPLLTKHLGKDWVMPREQMFFYETDIKEYRQLKKLHVWAREMAANDRMAFTPSYKSVFDPDLLMRYRDSIADPVGVFGLKGFCGKDEVVPKRYQPTGKLGSANPIRVTADWSRHFSPFQFELYHLRFKGWNEFDEAGKIIIWEWPKRGETYSLATDNGDGLGADRTVIQILRKGGMGRCDSQVLEFCSDAISGVELWPWVLALGSFYAVMREGKYRLPILIPETNREGGRQLLKELEMRGWKSNDIYTEYKSRSTSRKSAGTVSYGWQMTPLNRDELIQRGIAAIENEVIEINSPALVDEMGSFIRDESGKKTAAKNRHDDRIICLFLAFQALYSEEARATGKDPTIERTRVIAEEILYPLATDEAAQPSRLMNELIAELNA